MKKNTALLLAVILVSGLFVSCGIINPEESNTTKETNTEQTTTQAEETTTKAEETTKGAEENDVPDVAVFDTENIQRITFYAYYGDREVPAENMAEIIAWLETFTIDQKAPDLLAPGTNTWHVNIEYSDCRIVDRGLNVVSVDGVLYEVKSAKEPKCFENIISKTNLE